LLLDLLALEASLLLGYAFQELFFLWLPAKVPLEAFAPLVLASAAK